MTPRAFAQEEFQEVMAKTDDARIQNFGISIAAGLTGQLGIAEALAVLTVAMGECCSAVLHCESPMPELNIATLHSLVDAIKQRIRDHEECAIRRSATLRGVEADTKPPAVN